MLERVERQLGVSVFVQRNLPVDGTFLDVNFGIHEGK